MVHFLPCQDLNNLEFKTSSSVDFVAGARDSELQKQQGTAKSDLSGYSYSVKFRPRPAFTRGNALSLKLKVKTGFIQRFEAWLKCQFSPQNFSLGFFYTK